MVNGATVSIEYGRPFLKKRPESQMMPVGQPWRTGADEATVITTDKPLTFGALRLQGDRAGGTGDTFNRRQEA